MSEIVTYGDYLVAHMRRVDEAVLPIEDPPERCAACGHEYEVDWSRDNAHDNLCCGEWMPCDGRDCVTHAPKPQGWVARLVRVRLRKLAWAEIHGDRVGALLLERARLV